MMNGTVICALGGAGPTAKTPPWVRVAPGPARRGFAGASSVEPLGAGPRRLSSGRHRPSAHGWSIRSMLEKDICYSLEYSAYRDIPSLDIGVGSRNGG